MKSVRPFLFGLLAVVGVIALVIGVALVPAVQTWAARRYVAGQPGLEVSLDRVAAGFNSVRVEGVRVVRDGAVLVLPSAEADLPVVTAAWGNKLLVHRLVAHGWTLDLTKLQPKPARTVEVPATRDFSLLPSAYAADVPAATAAAFTGIFDRLRLPFGLALDSVDLAGDVLLPAGPDYPAARMTLSITGGGLATRHPGRFDYTAVVRVADQAVAVRELTIRGTLGVVMDDPQSISRFVVTTRAEVVGPQFPQGVQLVLDISAAHAAHGETYAISVASGTKQLAAVEMTYQAGVTHFAGSWRVDMRDTDLAPFAFGHALPLFEAAGDGRFELDTAFTELRTSGRLKANLDRLRVIAAELAGLGALRVTADFDVAQHAGATRVDRLAVSVEGARPVATVQALQAFEFNLRTGELKVADPAQELLGVDLQGLPLAWVAPFVAKFGYAVEGGELKGGFAAGARNGGFALRPKTPLSIAGLTLARTGGRTLLAGVDVLLALSGDYTPQGWQVELAPFSLRRDGATLFSVEGRVGQLAGTKQPVKAVGKWSGQLPALLAQPGLLGATALTAGDAQGDFAASLAEKAEIQVRLELRNLAAAAVPRLPAVTLEVRADQEPSGRVTFSLPVKLERDGRKSDLTISGTVMPREGGVAIDARVASDFLAVEDAQILAAPFAKPPGSSTVAATAAPPTAPAPFWSGVTGQVSLALKKVVYNGQFQLTDVAGQLNLDAGSLRLTNGRGGFDSDSAVKAAGQVTYAAGRPEPYELAADVALNNFPTAPAFRAIDPARLPTVEARINLTSRLAASGRSPGDLVERAHGDLMVTSKGGIFRGLSADLKDRIQRTQSRVTAIASFLGVVPDDYVNKTRILSDIAAALAEIPFDQLSFTATRDAALNLQLKDFTLISPEVRVVGEGSVRAVEGVPLLAQPLEMQLNLGARGKLGDLIRRAGLLDKRQDSLGYAAFAVPLRIGGTIGSPDTNEIRTALLNSALERSGLIDSLLGK